MKFVVTLFSLLCLFWSTLALARASSLNCQVLESSAVIADLDLRAGVMANNVELSDGRWVQASLDRVGPGHLYSTMEPGFLLRIGVLRLPEEQAADTQPNLTLNLYGVYLGQAQQFIVGELKHISAESGSYRFNCEVR